MTEAREVTMDQPIFHYGPLAVAENIIKCDGFMEPYHLQRLATGVVYEHTGEEVPVNMSETNKTFAMMDAANPFVAAFLEKFEKTDVFDWGIDFSAFGPDGTRQTITDYLSDLRASLNEQYEQMVNAQEGVING